MSDRSKPAIVVVCRSVVEEVIVVDELHVFGPKLHVPLIFSSLRGVDVGRNASHEHTVVPFGKYGDGVSTLRAQRFLTATVIRMSTVQHRRQVGALVDTSQPGVAGVDEPIPQGVGVCPHHTLRTGGGA